MLDNATRLWVVHIGNNAKIAKRAQDEGFICIGWTKVGDLSPYDTREKMKAAYERAFPTKSAASVRSSYGQVFKFAHEMQVGDAVVYPIKGGRDVMVGEIAGPYEWSDDPELREGDYNNKRKVRWIERVPRVRFSSSALNAFGAFSSVSTSDDFLDEVRDVLAGKDAADTPPAAASAGADDETQESEEEAVNAAEDATQSTKDYLLKRWTRTAQDFEQVAAAVFRALGYTATVQQGTRDGGVDVVAHKDPLGVEPPILKIQCKSGTGTSGGPDINKLRGTLNIGEKGIFISLGGFTQDALHTERNDSNLVLIDSDRFVELFLKCYAELSPEMRHRFPLQTVYVVAGSG
jgi:restriction system protein